MDRPEFLSASVHVLLGSLCSGRGSLQAEKAQKDEDKLEVRKAESGATSTAAAGTDAGEPGQPF